MTKKEKDQILREKENEKQLLCDAIEAYAGSLKERVIAKFDEGLSGWDDPDRVSDLNLRCRIADNVNRANVGKIDYIDAGALAMFAWMREVWRKGGEE